REVARFVDDHLKHPDRDRDERDIALGKVQIVGLNGPLTKRQALARHAERDETDQPERGSWLVEATTKSGRKLRNRVRLRSREEAETYIEAHVRFDLKRHGYASAVAIRCDDAPNCSVIRTRKGGRPTLSFPDGQCIILDWRPFDTLK